ncbi:hypothetical protein HMPREF3204_00662, partial [Gardnerella pickettii]
MLRDPYLVLREGWVILRSRGLAALTPSPRRSNASALSGSANRDVSLARYSALTSSQRRSSAS